MFSFRIYGRAKKNGIFRVNGVYNYDRFIAIVSDKESFFFTRACPLAIREFVDATFQGLIVGTRKFSVTKIRDELNVRITDCEKHTHVGTFLLTGEENLLHDQLTQALRMTDDNTREREVQCEDE